MTEVDKTELPLDQAFSRIFAAMTSDLHTALPAQVVSFNSAEKTVSVQPVLKRLYEYSTKAENLPVIEDVPVVFPGSGEYWLTFDIEKDSYVLLIVAERSLETWLNQGGIVDPQQERRFDLSDAIAIPGLIPKPIAATPSIASGTMALTNRLGTNGFKLSATAAEMFFGANSVKVDATGVHITGLTNILGNVIVTGTVTAIDFIVGAITLLTHIHEVLGPDTGPAKPPGP